MLVAIIVLSVLVVALSVALYFSFRLNVKLSAFATRFEENYAAAQDKLQELYDVLNTALSTPVRFDDPVTRRVLAKLRRTREEIFDIARLVSMQEEPEGSQTEPAEGDEDDDN